MLDIKLALPVLLLTLAAAGGACGAAPDWDLYSDTWVATDALGRGLPGYAECGPPRSDRYVGIFYFIWHGQHGAGGPYDITKILAENPNDPKWGPVHAFHHWGQPELGYYLSNDEWVIRRHCSMLADAGVDTLIFDVTNGFTYTEKYLLLCKVFEQIRREGGETPQICFIANSGSDDVVQRLYDDFYSKNLYPDLWFRWQGKPLMLARPDNLPQALKDFFTFRQSWAWSDPNGWFGDGRDKWPWLDHCPQAFGWHEKDVPEEVPVCVAQHATTNIGRSFHDGKQPRPKDFRTAEGLCFAEQWKRALELDPQFIFITGWNEWTAMRFISEGRSHMLGRKLPKGESYFVDEYNQEYSRDIEPMKGGHTDNYYYQMIDGIRRFKGVRRLPRASAPKTIKIDGDFSDWRDVQPEYRDTIGDTEHRSSTGWGSAGTYVNNTGRNDFVRMKVARDSKNVYFYAETKDDITSRADPNWMLLFIDTDCDSSTGWHGFDLLVNCEVLDDHRTTVKRTTTGWNWKTAQTVEYAVKGNKIEIAIPAAHLGGEGAPRVFDFHWADNIQKPDDIIEFAVSGDSAPNRRFNYRYSTLPD